MYNYNITETKKILEIDELRKKDVGNINIIFSPSLCDIEFDCDNYKLKHKNLNPDYRYDYILHDLLHNDLDYYNNFKISDLDIKPSLIENKDDFYKEKYKLISPIYVNNIIPDYCVVFENNSTNLKECKVLYSFKIKDSNLGLFLNKQKEVLFKRATIDIEYDTFSYYLNGIEPGKTGLFKRLVFSKSSFSIEDMFRKHKLIPTNFYNIVYLIDEYFDYNNVRIEYMTEKNIEELDLDIDDYNYNNEHKIINNDYRNLDEVKLNNVKEYIKFKYTKEIDENKLYYVCDKYDTLYSTKILNNEVTLNSYNNNVALFCGNDKKYTTLNIIKNSKDVYNNLIVNLNKETLTSIFLDGDFFEIKCDNVIWRVISNTLDCCYIAKHDYINYGRNVSFKTTNFTYTPIDYSSTNMLEIRCNMLINITENDPIYLTSNLFEHKKYYIDKIRYDYLTQEHVISIVDRTEFDFSNDMTFLKIEYKEPTYYYTYFNPKGINEIIAKKIADAFNSFKTIPVVVTNQGNDIIFRSNSKNDDNNITFYYNFNKTNTKPEYIKINNITAKGIDIKDRFNNYLFTSKHNIINLYGMNLNNIVLDKDVILDKNILIETKKGLYGLDKFIIEKEETRLGNYIDEYISKDDKIIKYNNLNKYNVYYIKTSDDIVLINDNTIKVHYKFKPKLIELEII